MWSEGFHMECINCETILVPKTKNKKYSYKLLELLNSFIAFKVKHYRSLIFTIVISNCPGKIKPSKKSDIHFLFDIIFLVVDFKIFSIIVNAYVKEQDPIIKDYIGAKQVEISSNNW